MNVIHGMKTLPRPVAAAPAERLRAVPAVVVPIKSNACLPTRRRKFFKRFIATVNTNAERLHAARAR